QHPGLSGIHPLRDARDAFAARILLPGAAERTLDVQYYIWHRDLSGTLLFKALHDAAQRGVRVRLLLDDNNTSGLDDILAALDAHPQIEVRLFNPFAMRHLRPLAYVTDFPRLNRRMHNKSFTADNQATVVGGRNVGDEYFGATDGVLFSDVDVLAVGPVVQQTSTEFDRYWNSSSAYPVGRLLPPAKRETLTEIKASAQRIERDPAAIAYMNAIRNSAFVQQLIAQTLPLEWAPTRVVADDPAKALGKASPDAMLVAKIRAIFGAPTKSIDLVSPYFVPGEEGTAMFHEWRQHGVRVRILTNSLEATDVAAVHAGYAKRREALLRDGVQLYELRRAAEQGGGGGSAGIFGSSAASLHAKSFAVDGARIFVGSFNFDPRSSALNTEMGFIIDSPALAHILQQALDEEVPRRAYEVQLVDGQLVWIERNGNVVRRLDKEPHAGFWRNAWVGLLAKLPIEWLL
ncbi:MAG: phospholipase D family protein, partial [Acidobacteria bacterium]|nr:phospholipase D family protein [Acidobacteriota bacterium]